MKAHEVDTVLTNFAGKRSCRLSHPGGWVRQKNLGKGKLWTTLSMGWEIHICLHLFVFHISIFFLQATPLVVFNIYFYFWSFYVLWNFKNLAIQHYLKKYVGDLRQVGGFLQALWFPPPIYNWNIVESCV